MDGSQHFYVVALFKPERAYHARSGHGESAFFCKKENTMSSQDTSGQDRTEKKYFDLHTRGVAYLNRYRIAKSKGGGYPCVKLVALSGETNSPERIPFDAKITASVAKELCAEYEAQINDYDTAVMVGFIVDGASPNAWTFTEGDRAGEQQLDIKCRLIRLAWIKIKAKGEKSFTTVYTQPDRRESETPEPAQEAA